MAEIKNLIVNGNARINGKLYSDDLNNKAEKSDVIDNELTIATAINELKNDMDNISKGNPIIFVEPGDGYYKPNIFYSIYINGGTHYIYLYPGAASHENTYKILLKIGTSTPTITWPADIVWENNVAPTINTNKVYLITILEGYASWKKFN